MSQTETLTKKEIAKLEYKLLIKQTKILQEIRYCIFKVLLNAYSQIKQIKTTVPIVFSFTITQKKKCLFDNRPILCIYIYIYIIDG